MKKITLIALREFSVRIRNKTFLISTLLLPIGIIVFYGAIFLFSSNDFDTYRIGVIDQDKTMRTELLDDANFKFIDLALGFNPNKKEEAEKYDLSATISIPKNQEDILKGSIEYGYE